VFQCGGKGSTFILNPTTSLNCDLPEKSNVENTKMKHNYSTSKFSTTQIWAF